MIIAKNDEAKRSKIWRIVMTASSAVIILIAVYLLVKVFTGNPLQGTWVNEDSNVEMEIKSGSSLTLRVPDLAEESSVNVKLDYSLDKDDKIFTISEDKEELKKLADKSDGMYTEEALEAALGSYMTSFTYSVDGEQLTLTEREYGDQRVLIRE